MSAGDTKEARARRVAERPLLPRPEVRDDGPLLRAALQWAYLHVYDQEGRPAEDPEKVRLRMAEYLGVDVSLVGHAERRRACSLCGGAGWCSSRGDTCGLCGGDGRGSFDFVQLPAEADDFRSLAPRERLEFFMRCPDVSHLPKAPEDAPPRMGHCHGCKIAWRWRSKATELTNKACPICKAALRAPKNRVAMRGWRSRLARMVDGALRTGG